jgi:hypothetical protein
MKIYFRIFGWLLCTACLYTYVLLWIYEDQYISSKIGTCLALALVLVTNFISPPLYLIWHWIADGFPIQFLFIWLGALTAASIGILLLFTGDA